MKQTETAQAKLSEIKLGALKHYEELSTKCHDWYNFIPKAINHYKPLRKGKIFEIIYNLITKKDL